jgi:hypothetical protein
MKNLVDPSVTLSTKVEGAVWQVIFLSTRVLNSTPSLPLYKYFLVQNFCLNIRQDKVECGWWVGGELVSSVKQGV